MATSTPRWHTATPTTGVAATTMSSSSNPMSGSDMLPLQQTIKHYLLLSKTRKLNEREMQEFEDTRRQLLPQLQRRTERATATATKVGRSAPSLAPYTSSTIRAPTARSGRVPLADRTRPALNSGVPQPEDTTPAGDFRSMVSSSQMAKRKRVDSNPKNSIASGFSAALTLLSTGQENVGEVHSVKRVKASVPTTAAVSLSTSSSLSTRKPFGLSTTTAAPLSGKENEPSGGAVQGTRRKKAKNSTSNNNQLVPSNVLRENKNVVNGVLPDKGKAKDYGAATATIDRPILGARTNQFRQQHPNTLNPNTISILAQTTHQQHVRRAHLVLPTDENLLPSQAQSGNKISNQKSIKSGKAETVAKGSTSVASSVKSSRVKPRLDVYHDVTSAPFDQSTFALAKIKREKPDIYGFNHGTHPRQAIAGARSLVTTSRKVASPSAPSGGCVSHPLHLECVGIESPPPPPLHPTAADNEAKPSRPTTPASQRVVETQDVNGKTVLEILGSEEDYELPVEDPRADGESDTASTTTPLFVRSSQTQHVVHASQDDELEEEVAQLDDFIETLPAPDFLQELEEEEHDEGVADAAHDAPTQLQEQAGGEKTPYALPSGKEVSTTIESSIQKDGVWCLEHPGQCVERVVCGAKDGWMAVETQYNLGFWKLENDNEALNPKWKLAFSWPKHSMAKPAIVFSEHDSHAVIIHEWSGHDSPMQQVLTVVDLMNDRYPTQQVDVDWHGMEAGMEYACLSVVPSDTSDASHLEQESHMLLLLGCKNKTGTVIALAIPKDICLAEEPEPLQAMALSTVDAPASISSLQLVDNCDGLCVATFANTLVLWDLSMLEQGPLTTIDLSTLSPQWISTPLFRVLRASVPQELYEEYADIINAGLLTPRDWPIYIVLEVYTKPGYIEQVSMALMSGHGEIVQRYEKDDHENQCLGNSSASSTLLLTSSFFNLPYESTLGLWNLNKATKLATLSVKMPLNVGSKPEAHVQDVDFKALSTAKTEDESTDHPHEQPSRKLSLASTVATDSTLSAPPGELTITSDSSDEESKQGEEKAILFKHATWTAKHASQARTEDATVDESVRVEQWVDEAQAATATTAAAHTSEKSDLPRMMFYLHPHQPWLVMAYSGLGNEGEQGSMLHVVDLSAIV